MTGDHKMYLHHFFEQSATRYPDNIALICDNVLISYQELDAKSNQLAHYLQQNKLGANNYIGILLERSVECYIAILAILKIGATYVPIEVDYPDERINYIFANLTFSAVITSSTQLAHKNLAWPQVFALDMLHEEISRQLITQVHGVQAESNSLCYVIYTSGSTGKPKGVEVPHHSICHYVREASTIYQISQKDKIYQGFSLAFDASLEEIWMAFAHGATLVACTSKEIRSGLGLNSFLNQYQITVLSTVPSVLSVMENNLPHLRLLILGGEVCTSKLINKWINPNLRILNTYGPTETSVIATYAECRADKNITIGKPLPGYDVFVLDDQLQKVAVGEKGELFIGGSALAKGYVQSPVLTAEKFIYNPANRTQKLYRTGDLVWQNEQGDLCFAGRIDNQVKIRGFRIELNEIEQLVNQYSGIDQCVVSVKSGEQPVLIAYFKTEKARIVDHIQLKMYLRSLLPEYMIPAHFHVVDDFKLLTSGKIDRNALPEIDILHTDKVLKLPETELGKQIIKVWEDVLNHHHISADDNFFYDLGGHSLLAAKVVSDLRKIPNLKNISILDLYKNPSVDLLEHHFKQTHDTYVPIEPPKKNKYHVPQWKFVLCGVGQFFGCLFQYALGTFQLLAIALCYSWLTLESSLISQELQLGFLALFLSLPFLSLCITVCLKWILLGRIKPGEYRLWGWFYYRWWLVQRLQKNLYLSKFLVGTPLITLYFRMLGARIGKNCHLGSMQIAVPDLLSIGNNTSINTDSRLYGYLVEDGWLKIGYIDIGSNCYIGCRAVVGFNTSIQDNSILDDMSMLPEQSYVPKSSYYSGSPAKAGKVPNEHVTNKKVITRPSGILSNITYGVLHYLGMIFVTVLFYLCLIPGLSLVTYFYDQNFYFTTMLLAIPAGSIMFLCLHYFCIVLCKKIILNQTNPGIYSVKSFYYFRHWILVKMLDGDEISIMADTLFMPIFLRFLGAKLGKGVEMGETPHIIPDLVTIEEGGFTASSVALAWPSVHLGMIHFAPIHIGRRGFIGNVSLVPAGKRIGEGGLLGCLSIAPSGNQAQECNSAWLGSPAVYLPKRELFIGFSDKDTFYPSKKLYCTRLIIEFFRVILPTSFSLIVLFNMLYVLDFMLNNYSWGLAAIVLPISELSFTLGMISILIALKWGLLGRLEPLTKPIWNVFIWKNDVIEYSYNYYINPHFTNKVLGTPFALWIQKCLGTKVGKRVFTESAEFSEFDLISIGDEVCINAETIIQTHLYEDRIFKVSNVSIHSECNIGVGSIVLYNTVMERNSSLGSLSLLMKGECLPRDTQWGGIPAQSNMSITGIHPLAQFVDYKQLNKNIISESM